MIRTNTRPRLADEIVQTLRTRISDGTYAPSSRLPTEEQLCSEFNVSRATVRTATKALNVLGLVTTRRGLGTFVSPIPQVEDGLEKMTSISESIIASGRVPSMDYKLRSIRKASADEARPMRLEPGAEILELHRRIMADGKTVAFSYDLIPMSIFPMGFDPRQMTASIFAFFSKELGLDAALGLARVHAVYSDKIAWGPDAENEKLFLLLDQLQYTDSGVLLGHSKSYFIEGSYSFVLRRTNQ